MTALTKLVFVAMLWLPVAAHAQDTATGDAIRTAVSGNTVQGSMTASGAYTEFYAEDGTIKGADYAGKWTIEGDTMCFAYDAAPDCWNARIEADAVTWVQNGSDGGTGTIVAGNPNGF